ncbi:MAG: hypothetical protein N2C14_07365, partial [Planctomycetales bacterium]
FLQQNLGYDVIRLEAFSQLSGPMVVESPQFKENLLTFTPCYGLAIQALKKGSIQTNLLPQEIVTERLVREKKPWAMATAASLLLGLTISTVGYSRAWSTVHESRFKNQEKQVDAEVMRAQGLQTQFQERVDFLKNNKKIGARLVNNLEQRLYWLELLKAVDACLPQNELVGSAAAKDPQPEQVVAANHEPIDEDEWWNGIRNQEHIHITRIEVERVASASEWWTAVQELERKAAGSSSDSGRPDFGANSGSFGSEDGDDGGGEDGDGGEDSSEGEEEGEAVGPSGLGWIIQLTGHHYHNPVDDPAENGREYLTENFLNNLKEARHNGVDVGDLGIAHPTIIRTTPISWTFNPLANKHYTPPEWNLDGSGYPGGGRGGGSGGSRLPGMTGGGFSGGRSSGGLGGQPYPGGGGGGGRADVAGVGPREDSVKSIKLPRFDFQIQFIWQETDFKKRETNRKSRSREQNRKAREAAEQAEGDVARTEDS